MRRGNIIRHVITAAIFIALEIAALAMLGNNGTLQRMWFSEAAQGFMGSIWGSTQQVTDYFHLRSANDSLALENHALRVKVAQMEEAMEAFGAAKPEFAEGKTGHYSYIPLCRNLYTQTLSILSEDILDKTYSHINIKFI